MCMNVRPAVSLVLRLRGWMCVSGNMHVDALSLNVAVIDIVLVTVF